MSASRDANIARQLRFWTRRARSWDHGAANNPGLVKVVERVISESDLHPSTKAVDLGCGSGQLTLQLAPHVESIIAVDVSPAMIELLSVNAREAGIENIEPMMVPIERLDLPRDSVDLVVSNYALHHLRDTAKSELIVKVATWLRPGGQVIIGDMMFGRGATADDRQIIASKVSIMIRRGPAGWWRILKNGYRYLVRFQERPISTAHWVSIFHAAGLQDVAVIPIVNEAAIVRGTRGPATDSAS